MRRQNLDVAVCLATFVALSSVALVDASYPAWDWVELAFSRYVHTPYGWLVRLAIFSAALVSLCAYLRLRTSWETGAAAKVARVSLAASTVGLVIAGIVRADPPVGPMSWQEVVHGLSGWVAFFGFIPFGVAVTMLARRGRALLIPLLAGSVLGTVMLIVIWLGQVRSYESFPWGAHVTTLGLAERFTFAVNLILVCVAVLAHVDDAPAVGRDAQGSSRREGPTPLPASTSRPESD